MNGGFLALILIVAGFYVGQVFADQNANGDLETNAVQTELGDCMELTGYPTDYYGHCSEPDENEPDGTKVEGTNGN